MGSYQIIPIYAGVLFDSSSAIESMAHWYSIDLQNIDIDNGPFYT